MEAATAAARGVSLSQSSSRKQWRAVSEHSVRNSATEGQEPIDVVDFCAVQMDGIMGMEEGILQQRIQSLARQREEMQQMEIELRAQMIVKSEILEMQNSFDARSKEQSNMVARLQEQLHERDQAMHELERKMEDKERELHAVRLDNEAAWAKEDLLREQNKELASFRRERDGIETERAHHRKQVHDLQEHIQDKERQLLELQEQHRVAQENLLYKDEQIREAQNWMARMQENVLQSTTMQAELRERTEQYSQLWLGCQRQTNHAPTHPIAASILGMPYLPPGQITAMHPYVLHQEGANHSVAAQVPQSHVGNFQSVSALASLHQWQNQQAVSEGAPMPSQSQFSLSQTEENPSRSDPNYSYEFSVNGQSLHPDYLNTHISQGNDPKCQMSSNGAAQTLESVEKSYYVGPDSQHSLQQISSQFQEALRLELNQNSEIKADESEVSNISNNELENQDAATDLPSSIAGPSPSDTSVNSIQFADGSVNDASDAVLSEAFVSNEPANSLPTGDISESALLDERALLACIVRTIPAGGKIRISSTLPNRLGKMLAPLHWHDYKRKYGKLDEFVNSHPELFLIEGDYIQLREGAQGIIAATAAMAKVAAAAAASSPYTSFFPPVAVTPMAHAGRVKKLSSVEHRPMRNSADNTLSSAMQSHHSNGSGYVSGNLANVKILSKSKDPLDHNGSELRSVQSMLLSTESGVHSDRSILGNPQNQVPIHARGSANYISKQQGRTSGASLASRR